MLRIAGWPLLLAAGLIGCSPGQDTGAERSPVPEGYLAIVGANVIPDPAAGALLDATVLVRAGEVVAVGARRTIRVPPTAQVVDATGSWMIPGLWDMHVHLTDATELALPVLLANGVTAVRDMGGDVQRLRDMNRRRSAGVLAGPRIFFAGPYVDGPKPGLPYRLTVETASEGVAAADSVHRLGTDFIKVHNGVPAAAYFALLERAAELGLPVAGHVPVEVDPVAAARAGQASLEHFATLFEGTLRSHASSPTALRAYLTTGLDTLARAIAATDAFFTPTADTYRLRALRGELARQPDPRLRYVASSLRRQWDEWYPVQERDTMPEIREARLEFYRIGLEVVERMHEAGVPILVGTDLGARDGLPGFEVHDELGSLVQAGLTPAEALAAATTVPARFLAADSLGSIVPGRRADIVLLAADPRVDIGATRGVRAVIADGRYYSREVLDSLLTDAAARADSY